MPASSVHDTRVFDGNHGAGPRIQSFVSCTHSSSSFMVLRRLSSSRQTLVDALTTFVI